MASPPAGHRPRSHSLSLPLGTTGLAPRSPLLERDLFLNRNSGFDKHSRSGSYGSGLGLALEGLGVPRSRSPTSATDSTSSAATSEILTPASSPLREQPLKTHDRARSNHDSICESAEHAIDLDGDYETVFEGTNGGAGGGGGSLYANGARWGWPSSGAAPIGQLPSRRTSAPLLSGSLPASSNFAPLSRVMSGGSGNNGFGSAVARERDNGNTPEGLGLFRRLSVGFASKVRRNPSAYPEITVLMTLLCIAATNYLSSTLDDESSYSNLRRHFRSHYSSHQLYFFPCYDQVIHCDERRRSSIEHGERNATVN